MRCSGSRIFAVRSLSSLTIRGKNKSTYASPRKQKPCGDRRGPLGARRLRPRVGNARYPRDQTQQRWTCKPQPARPRATLSRSALWRELADVFTNMASDESVRAVVLTSAGKDFSVGADVTEFGGHTEKTGIKARPMRLRSMRARPAIANLPQTGDRSRIRLLPWRRLVTSRWPAIFGSRTIR